MPTWEARYVRVGNHAHNRNEDLERLRADLSRRHPAAKLVETPGEPSGLSFAGWLMPASKAGKPDGGGKSGKRQPAPAQSLELADEQGLIEVSRDFGEAIGIAIQTVADLVVYDHFVAGHRARGLTYAGEAGWVRVVGEPEPWESRALFSDTKLAELLAALEDDLTGDALARDKAELERLWKTQRLEEGLPRPPVEPMTLRRAIERHFALPTLK
jgi:hypothetical protein